MLSISKGDLVGFSVGPLLRWVQGDNDGSMGRARNDCAILWTGLLMVLALMDWLASKGLGIPLCGERVERYSKGWSPVQRATL